MKKASKHKKVYEENDPSLISHPGLIEHKITLQVRKGESPKRIDKFLKEQILNATRNKIQAAIDENRVLVDGKPVKASKKIKPGELIECTIMKSPPVELVPQNIPLDIVYEDEYLLVVNKKAGMVTHPGVGNRYNTLVNALIYHFGQREAITFEDEFEDDEDEAYIYAQDNIRPGIVHRLDKDTSGLLVIAKNLEVHNQLQEQFATRTVSRTYYALCWGNKLDGKGQITGNIGRSNYDRKKFAVVQRGGKNAITDFQTLEKFDFASLLKLKLQTGRTHQIRVHLSHNKHPIIGDNFYGGDINQYHGTDGFLKNLSKKVLLSAERQMLHAKELSFLHPISEEIMTFSTEFPEDFLNVYNLICNL